MTEHKRRIALIAGSTGLIGSHLLETLTGSGRYEMVVTIGRRDQANRGSTHRHYVVDFDDLSAWKSIDHVDCVFCCLGTTIRKAGSREAFERVDRHYPVALAKRALELGARQYSIVTSQGASTRSPFFYSRVKGLVEQDLADAGFYGTYFFRPTLLLGERDERRRGEDAAERVLRAAAPLLRGPLAGLKPVHGRVVASAMAAVAEDAPGGLKAFEAADIRAIAAIRTDED